MELIVGIAGLVIGALWGRWRRDVRARRQLAEMERTWANKLARADEAFLAKLAELRAESRGAVTLQATAHEAGDPTHPTDDTVRNTDVLPPAPKTEPSPAQRIVDEPGLESRPSDSDPASGDGDLDVSMDQDVSAVLMESHESSAAATGASEPIEAVSAEAEAEQPEPEADQPAAEAEQPEPEAEQPEPEADQPEAEPERQSAELDTVLTPTEESGTGRAEVSPSTEADKPAADQVEPTDLPPIWMLDRRPHEPEFEKGNEEDTPAEIDDPILEGLARLAEADFDEEEDDTLTHADPAGAVEAESAQVHEPDDLTLIRGIGPKIALLLQSRGITRFGQLATASVEQINDILEAGGQSYTLADPSMWSLQAHLAAEGRWLALRALQAAGKDVD